MAGREDIYQPAYARAPGSPPLSSASVRIARVSGMVGAAFVCRGEVALVMVLTPR